MEVYGYYAHAQSPLDGTFKFQGNTDAATLFNLSCSSSLVVHM